MNKRKPILLIVTILFVCLLFSSCSSQSEGLVFDGSNSEENSSSENDDFNIFDYCIPASEAIDYVGEEANVMGYVVSWSSPGTDGNPLFINLDADYPDDNRCTSTYEPKF